MRELSSKEMNESAPLVLAQNFPHTTSYRKAAAVSFPGIGSADIVSTEVDGHKIDVIFCLDGAYVSNRSLAKAIGVRATFISNNLRGIVKVYFKCHGVVHTYFAVNDLPTISKTIIRLYNNPIAEHIYQKLEKANETPVSEQNSNEKDETNYSNSELEEIKADIHALKLRVERLEKGKKQPKHSKKTKKNVVVDSGVKTLTAARALGISRASTIRLIQSGKLKATRSTDHKAWLVSRYSLGYLLMKGQK